MGDNRQVVVLGQAVADNPYELAVKAGIFNGTLEEYLISLKGKDGIGIKSFILSKEEPLQNTYKITFTDDSSNDIIIPNGKNGTNGTGIVSITLTSSKQLEDTYTITYTDGRTDKIVLMNGADGDDGNGILNIALKETVGIYDTYVVTYTDGRKFEYQVRNGTDGVGIQNIVMTDRINNIDTYTITLTNGVKSTFNVTNGINGGRGIGIKSIKLESSVNEVDTYVITFTDETTFKYNITNGKDGKINGYNEMNFIEGENVRIVQNENEMTIHAISKTDMLPIPTSELPIDFPRFTVTGESQYEGNFFVTPHTTKDFPNNYIFIINPKGEVLKYKKIESQAYDFKKVLNSKGQTRYTYLDVISTEVPTEGNVGFYENSELVILDEYFDEIDRIKHNKAGEIPEDYPAENHFSLFIDDGHYIIASYFKPLGSNKYENSIQEIKWNHVIWHWETNDLPELANYSHTTPTGDYAHINAMNIDYDGNFIISFRNIGLIKLNKETKEIMWMIGRRRNDFTGIEASQIPFQQHDIRIYRGDGSISVFDNYGHSSKSRICRYYLNEQTMTCDIYEEHLTTKNRSNYMGSAQLVNDTNDVYIITYGSGWNFGFEEYDFVSGKQNMQFTFNEGHDVYNVYKDISDLKASYNGDKVIIPEPPVDPPVDPPEITYTLENEKFDGTRHINTGIKLFDESKDFSFIIKWEKDAEDIPSTEYRVLLHNLLEVQPWQGLTIQSYAQSAILGSSTVALHLTNDEQFKFHTEMNHINQVTPRFITVVRKSTGETDIKYLKDDGSVLLSSTYDNPFSEGEYQQQELILGAADMGTEMDRFFKGTIYNFNYYNKVLSDNEMTTILNTLI